MQQLLTISDVADRLRLSSSSVRRLVNAGLLRTVKIGGAVRVSTDELERFVGDLIPVETRSNGQTA